VEPRVLDVNQVVSGIEKMLSRLVGEDIDIQVRLADGIGHVVADPWQIEQVIMNLTVNARDAMPHGGRLVIQTAESNLEHAEILPIATMQRRTYVVLSVADTGCGMDEATRARIFEPFYTTKMVGKGTGLGLATVYGIVKQSGGDVAVETEVGRGTTFSVYLPREDAPATVTTRRSEPVTGTGHGTVLVVEDEDAVREIVVRSLRGAGYEILSARSGGDALVLCEKWAGRIDLLLTDVVMPQMSGPELAQRLTQQMPSLKVLFMSGYPDDSIVHHGVLNTGVRLISKPYETTELARVVRDVLDEGACVELQDAVAVPAYDSIGDTVGPNS
jgi:CheY-like chemotaxis protein